MLVAYATQVLRPCRRLASGDRRRGRFLHRSAVRDRTDHQRRQPRSTNSLRQEQAAPILAELEPWLRAQRDRVSPKSEIGKAITYALKRWPALTRFLTDGRICLSNNATERALRSIAPSAVATGPSPAPPAAVTGPLPQAWLADVLDRIQDHPASRLRELLP